MNFNVIAFADSSSADGASIRVALTDSLSENIAGISKLGEENLVKC